ncbi:CPBP family intramembrane metalloprotease [Bacillus sp. HMF5848]|uniref:CPBP family intramembrane glutamic endopeptidase n=1 Tax=Bacillus sp. HMF5848 TaxID=2495421 RepID=UPI000F77DADD|nr:CPBP family intramembrane glutamic endopeptidase [Bacillus sp. HMF5848]RSK25960.1 CPBP family intramembrane metalloprotease [Bacillus sp. HMF5848]
MPENITNARKALIFTILIFVFVALFLLAPLQLEAGMFMFVPFLAMVLTMLISGDLFVGKSWGDLKLRIWNKKVFLGLLAAVPMLIGYTVVWVLNISSFQGTSDSVGKIFVEAIILLIGTSVSSVLAEEIGWRGYLYNKLISMGFMKSQLLIGVIWGSFHLPIIIFNGDYHSDTNLLLYIPLFMVTIILASVFIGYVRFVSGSLWAASLAHAAHNLAWHYGEQFSINANEIATYLTGDAGIIIAVVYGLAALWIAKRMKQTYAHKNELTA